MWEPCGDPGAEPVLSRAPTSGPGTLSHLSCPLIHAEKVPELMLRQDRGPLKVQSAPGPEMSLHIWGQDYQGRGGFLTFIHSFIRLSWSSSHEPGAALGAAGAARTRRPSLLLSSSPVLVGERRLTRGTSLTRKLSHR